MFNRNRENRRHPDGAHYLEETDPMNWHQGKNDRKLLEALIEDAIIKNGMLERMMADFTTLNANVSTLQSAANTLIAAIPTGTGVEDPAIQAGIDSAANAVSAVTSQLVAATPVGTTPPPVGVPEVDAAGNPVLDANGNQLIGVPVLNADGTATLDASGNPEYTPVPSVASAFGNPANTPNMIHSV